MDKCRICEKHENNIDVVYENDLISISHYIRQPEGDKNYLGYYMIESIRHFTGMENMSDTEIEMVGKALKYLSKAMKKVLEVEKVYSFVIGEGVDHFHVHVVGRYKNAPRDYWGPSVDDWPDAPRGDIDKIREINREIQKELFNEKDIKP